MMKEKDAAQDFYKKQNRKLDLDRDTDIFGGFSFFLGLSPLFLVFLWQIYRPLLMLISVGAIFVGMISMARIDSDKKLKGRAWAIFGMIFGLLGFMIELFFAMNL